MPAGLVALLIFVIAVPSVVFLSLIFLPYREESGDPVRDRNILDHIADEGALRYDSWQLEPSHRAPYLPFTPEEAHKEMQRHRDCTTEGCERKAAAFYSLVAAGRATPDTSRGRR